MMYVWDTDTCIYWLKGRDEIRLKVQEIGGHNLGITIVTLAELKYGAYNSKKVRSNLEAIENLLRRVRVLTMDQESADRFGSNKAELRTNGELIEDFDILIASTSLIHEAILVTNNIEHFKRIKGLKVESRLYEA
jgi:tRNA(fMet)-specific endonuclease VapC